MDLEGEPVERRRARLDALRDPLLARRGVQLVLRLPRTRRRTRGENELGQDEARNDESAGDETQPVDGAKQTERRDERAHLDAAAHGTRGLWPTAARTRKRRIPLVDDDPDEGDRACDRDGPTPDDRGDRERLTWIAGQQQEHDGGESRQSAQWQQLLAQLSSTFERGSIRNGSATCSPPAAIGACASVSIALEALERARSVSSNFFVAFSR